MFKVYAVTGALFVIFGILQIEVITTTLTLFLMLWTIVSVAIQTKLIGNLHNDCDRCAAALKLGK